MPKKRPILSAKMALKVGPFWLMFGLPWVVLGYLGPSCGYLFFTITTYCRLLLLLLEMVRCLLLFPIHYRGRQELNPTPPPAEGNLLVGISGP